MSKYLVSYLLLSTIFIVSLFILEQKVFLPILIYLLLSTLIFQVAFYKMTSSNIFEKFNHLASRIQDIQSHISLHSNLNLNHPLPPFDEWHASPVFLHHIVSLINEVKPRLIIEAGSGNSTLVSASFLKFHKFGQLITLEHDKYYAKRTQDLILLNDLDAVAKVEYSPITNQHIDNHLYQWYDISVLNNVELIDMMIIDGPPKMLVDDYLYPVLPLFYSRLNDKSAILIYNGKRKTVERTINLWKIKYNDITAKYIDMNRGAYLVQKSERII
tara:strand:+ start:178 stop:993 length:816 start_codon:yes stop_codon:yes gene_type:complete